jgi:hypothetical protein
MQTFKMRFLIFQPLYVYDLTLQVAIEIKKLSHMFQVEAYFINFFCNFSFSYELVQNSSFTFIMCLPSFLLS